MISDNQNEKIYAAKVFQGPSNTTMAEQMFGKMIDAGISEVFLLEQYYSRSYIQSELAKTHLKTWMISQIFFNDGNDLGEGSSNTFFAITDDGKAANGKGDGSWLEMACPNGGSSYNLDNPADGYREKTIARIVELIKTHKPYGVSLDFVRFFAFWEGVFKGADPATIPDACFCERCQSLFSTEYNVMIPSTLSTVTEKADWIHTNHQAEWTAFKTNTITSFVADAADAIHMIDPNIKINVHGVPWLNNEFDNGIKRIIGQDYAALSKIADVISPMCYSKMLKRNATWVNTVVEDLAGQVEINTTKIIPAIQIRGNIYGEGPIDDEEFGALLKSALKGTSNGVAFWPFELMSQSQLDILKEVLP